MASRKVKALQSLQHVAAATSCWTTVLSQYIPSGANYTVYMRACIPLMASRDNMQSKARVEITIIVLGCLGCEPQRATVKEARNVIQLSIAQVPYQPL